jgi:hypothetical protein
VRDEVRGLPRGSSESAARRRSPEPTNDLRRPSITGTPGPNDRGLIQTDAGPAARGPTDGNRPQAGGPDAAPRRAPLANDGGASPRNGSRNSTNPRLSDGASPGRPPISQYDSLMQQGKSLSRYNVRERPGTVDEKGNVDPRMAKNPIGSIGLGATPRRFGTPRTDSSSGRSLAGGGGGTNEDPSKRRSTGNFDQPALPRWQSGQRPQLPRLERNSPGSIGGGSTSRTYDPVRGY